MAASASSGFVENWQAGKTVTECNLCMLQKEDSCDITFRCGIDGHVVKAHRYMLISRSCVFHAMFTGGIAEISDVEIPDIEPLVFKSFLEYIYTDDTDVNADNVTGLLYTARKYGVTSLDTKCTEFLNRNLNPENACVILEVAHRFDKKELYEKALTLIKSEGERSLKSSGFLSLSRVLVEELVESDDLQADEHVIFTAVNDWSGAQCIREGREVTPESKRSVLGGILIKVRFPLMKPAFLADCVKASGLLTNEERLSCFDLAALPGKSLTVFNSNQRVRTCYSKCLSKNRFTHKGERYINGNLFHAIRFSSSSNLLLSGCQLYGRNQETHNVTSYFGDDDNVLKYVVQKKTEYICEGEVFDVIFSSTVSVSAGEWYTLAVKIEGPEALVGEYGQERVVCGDGVELQFRNSRQSNNWTDTRQGQIPSLIYVKRDYIEPSRVS